MRQMPGATRMAAVFDMAASMPQVDLGRIGFTRSARARRGLPHPAGQSG